MINHIVKPNETLSDILFKYNITKEELYKYNPQLNSSKSLKPSMVLKIKKTSNSDYDIVNNLEPFLEAYYEIVEEFDYIDLEEKNKKEKQLEENKENMEYRYINPYYMYPFIYY